MENSSLVPVVSTYHRELVDQRPSPSPTLRGEVASSIMRTAALIERHLAQVVASSGITIQQYNVLRILRGAGDDGLPTLVIRDRMIHEAPGITRLLDKLEESALVRRERTSSDRRQVFCRITGAGLTLLADLDDAMQRANDTAIGTLLEEEQQQLLELLNSVRVWHQRQSRKVS